MPAVEDEAGSVDAEVEAARRPPRDERGEGDEDDDEIEVAGDVDGCGDVDGGGVTAGREAGWVKVCGGCTRAPEARRA